MHGNTYGPFSTPLPASGANMAGIRNSAHVLDYYTSSGRYGYEWDTSLWAYRNGGASDTNILSAWDTYSTSSQPYIPKFAENAADVTDTGVVFLDLIRSGGTVNQMTLVSASGGQLNAANPSLEDFRAAMEASGHTECAAVLTCSSDQSITTTAIDEGTYGVLDHVCLGVSHTQPAMYVTRIAASRIT